MKHLVCSLPQRNYYQIFLFIYKMQRIINIKHHKIRITLQGEVIMRSVDSAILF